MSGQLEQPMFAVCRSILFVPSYWYYFWLGIIRLRSNATPLISQVTVLLLSVNYQKVSTIRRLLGSLSACTNLRMVARILLPLPPTKCIHCMYKYFPHISLHLISSVADGRSHSMVFSLMARSYLVQTLLALTRDCLRSLTRYVCASLYSGARVLTQFCRLIVYRVIRSFEALKML